MVWDPIALRVWTVRKWKDTNIPVASWQGLFDPDDPSYW